MNPSRMVQAADDEPKALAQPTNRRFSVTFYQGEELPEISNKWFRSLGPFIRRFLTSWRRLSNVENRHEQYKNELLDYVGPQARRIYDRKYDTQLTVFPTQPKVDLETLKEAVPPEIYRKCTVSCIKLEAWVPLTAKRTSQKILNRFSSYVGRFWEGWIKLDENEKVYVDEEQLRYLCEKNDIPFPEEAFEQTQKIYVRVNPKWPPGGRV